MEIALATISRLERSHVEYTRHEIVTARAIAGRQRSPLDFANHGELAKLWEIAHVLTSDESWGVGDSNYVCKYLKNDVEFFFNGLIMATRLPSEIITVISFMVESISMVNDRIFVILLRAHIFGFSKTLWCSETISDFKTMDMIDGMKRNITALHLCCYTDVVPTVVMKTLLEAGSFFANASIDHPNDRHLSIDWHVSQEDTASSRLRCSDRYLQHLFPNSRTHCHLR